MSQSVVKIAEIKLTIESLAYGGMGVAREYPLWRYCLSAKEHEIINGNIHIVNAVSPAFTSAIALGEYIVDLL